MDGKELDMVGRKRNPTNPDIHFQAPRVWERARTAVEARRWAVLRLCQIFVSFLVSQA